MDQINPVQIPNFAAGIGDAYDARAKFDYDRARINHLARQDDIALQNEMLKLKAARTAEANTAASKAAVKSALSNSVVGLPGEAAGPYMPSVQRATNALALQGRTTEANTLSNFLEQQAKQDTQRNLANKAAGEVDELTLKNEATMVAQSQAQIDMATSTDQLRNMVVRLHAPDSKLAGFFARNGVDPDEAIAEFDRMVASGMKFEDIRRQMSMGADKTATHLADLAQKEAQTYQANAAGNKSMGELDIAQGRAPVDIAQIQSQTAQNTAAAASSNATAANTVATGQRAIAAETAPIPKEVNLGNRIVIVDNNPRSPTFNQELTSLQMGAAPKQATTLNTLMAERDALPDGDSRRADYDAMIKKETAIASSMGVRPPSGYRYSADGQSLEMIPGGPAEAKANADKGTEISPEALDVAAHTYILSGTLPPGMGKNATTIRTQIMNRATEMANGRSADEFASDMRINKGDTAAIAKAQKDFGTGTQGKMVNSFNTAIDHLETVTGLIDALKNGDTKRINSVGNSIASEFGVAAPTNFDAAKQLVSSEIVKAINSSGGALADRQEAEATLSRANSPEQLKGIVDTYQKLLGGQLKSLKLQYSNMTGKEDFDKKLTDKAKAALNRVTGGGKTGTTSSGVSYSIEE
jgi:hypothetical protein